MNLRIEYSLEILLPESVDRSLREWAAQAPGATWPAWGGHVTLVNRFVPRGGHLDAICGRIDEITRKFPPFEIRLNRVLCDRHLLRPQFMTVLLAIDPDDRGSHLTLLRLQNALWSAVFPLVRDVTPQLNRRPYLPHLTLTWGADPSAARRLAIKAREDGVEARFRVEAHWLMRFNVSEEDGAVEALKVRSFRLEGSERKETRERHGRSRKRQFSG